MTSTIAVTPQNGADNKNGRVLKERERRARETAAFQNLRHALELAEPNTFWRMEKIDIALGAAAFIQKLTGVTSTWSSIRDPIDFDEVKSKEQTEKLSKVEVERLRRAKESQAVKKLKDILMDHTKITQTKMEKQDVLRYATELVRSLVKINKQSTNSPDSGTTSETGSPESGTSVSPGSTATGPVDQKTSVVPINSGLAPNWMIIPSMMQNLPFCGTLLVFPTPSIPINSNIGPALKKSRTRTEVWRPYL